MLVRFACQGRWPHVRSAAHSSFASILLLLPILAIPLFAIFGIPEFVPVAKSPLGEDATLDPTTAEDAPKFAAISDWESPTPPSRTIAEAPEWGNTQAQLQVPAFDQRRTTEPAEFSAGVTQVAWQQESLDAAQPPRKLTGQSQSMASTTLTWKSAVQRLQQLEIRSFRLEPGRELGQFNFICSYTPAHNPSVSYRFEAEADEPLKAVEKVLAQIDTWMAAR